MTVKEMQEKILKLKKEKDICILAHSYVAREIIEVADYTGDSFQLSVLAEKTDAKTVVMCGVRFMAETVKILSPEKTVYITSPVAGCPMAEQMSKEYIEEIKKEYPDYIVVAYINTTAALKAECDVCVTSSSAIKIVEKLPSDEILFIPDQHLGSFVQKSIPEKKFILWDGYCPVHAQLTKEDVLKCKEEHPDAVFAVHPESPKEVVELADMVGATSEIINYANTVNRKQK
mgnify:CR=1 FL=1